ncbi:MAG TPA: hypothetical protein VFS32_08580 [Candidatus Limnocylindrales bacterium]|nr:hypothetical protein [Candidatus Limnocylindrales bacterium]
MSSSAFSANPSTAAGDSYRPGVCNIGPAEIARRRRIGHVGLAATLIALAGLVLAAAPPIARLVLVVPAGAAASGYLQAALRFCAGFGARGVFNFGELGPTTAVEDRAARVRDRRRSFEINAASLLVGIVVAVVAVLLPL